MFCFTWKQMILICSWSVNRFPKKSHWTIFVMITLTGIFEQIAMYLKPAVSCQKYSTVIYLNSPDMFHIAHQNVYSMHDSRHLAAIVRTFSRLWRLRRLWRLLLLDSAICRQNRSFYIPVLYMAVYGIFSYFLAVFGTNFNKKSTTCAVQLHSKEIRD